MAQDADDALPGEELFFAKGFGEVAEDDELMGDAAFAEESAMKSPAAGAGGEALLDDFGGFGFSAE